MLKFVTEYGIFLSVNYAGDFYTPVSLFLFARGSRFVYAFVLKIDL